MTINTGFILSQSLIVASTFSNSVGSNKFTLTVRLLKPSPKNPKIFVQVFR